MAQPVVIQRLEEAVDALSSFEEETQAAREPLDQLIEGAGSLAEVTKEQGDRTLEAIESASEAVSELRTRIEEAAGEAREQLAEATEQASGLGEQAGGALAVVQQQLAAVGAAREALAAAVAAGLQVSQSEVQQVAGQVEALRAETSRGLEATLESVGELRSAVGEARQRLVQGRAEWEQALQALEASAADQTMATRERLQGLFARFSAAFVAAKNEVIDQHNDTMSQLWDNLAEEIPEELQPLFDSLGETLETLDALRQAHQANIENSCAEVVELAGDLSGVFEGLRSDLSQAAGRLPR